MDTIQKLKKMIDDPSVSDDELVKILKKELSDEAALTDTQISKLDKLGEYCDRKRPVAMQKFRKWFMKTHGKKCPACQKLQPK